MKYGRVNHFNSLLESVRFYDRWSGLRGLWASEAQTWARHYGVPAPALVAVLDEVYSKPVQAVAR